MKRICSNLLFSLLLFAALFLALWRNAPLVCSWNDGEEKFDAYSNGIMVADLMYRQHYADDSLFLHSITPAQLPAGSLGEDVTPTPRNTEPLLKAMFAAGQTFDQSVFVPYTSNIVAQRYLYAALDRLLPVSNGTLLSLLEAMNAALLAAVLLLPILYVRRHSGTGTAVVLAVLLGLFSPLFAATARHLYWCTWTLFLPFCAMLFLVDAHRLNEVRGVKRFFLFAAAAFALCALRMLHCFEFITTVMVSMTVPLFCRAVRDRMERRHFFTAFGGLTAGALAAFAAVFALRCWMTVREYGSAQAAQLIFSNLADRLTGNAASTDAVAAAAAQADLPETLRLMLDAPLFSIRSTVRLSAGGLLLLVAVVLAAVFGKAFRAHRAVPQQLKALAVGTGIALLAPLSWFILARPHTYVHSQYCQICWFCPFVILALALLAEALRTLTQPAPPAPQESSTPQELPVA